MVLDFDILCQCLEAVIRLWHVIHNLDKILMGCLNSEYPHFFISCADRFFCDAARADDNYDEDQTSKECQTVVCWNPSRSLYSQSIGIFQPFQQPHKLEITELDETGEDAVMDEAADEIQENSGSTGLSFPQHAQQQLLQEEPAYGFGLHQWQQQQNCVIPQLPQVSTTPTPITWFR